MLNQILNHSTLAKKQKFAQDFRNAEPFKHIVIDDFFNPEFCKKLLKEFPSFDEKLAMNENGEVGMKAVHEHISDLGSSYKTLDKLVKSAEFLNLIEGFTGIKNLKYDPYYFGGGTHNNLEGQDLDPHVDFTHHPISGQHRRMNLIVYLNKEWEKSWGGNIELHKNPRLEPENDETKSVEPLFNRAVIFETNNISWHGFPRINLPEDKKDLSRKSFALYYYTDSRDAVVKPHSTIYVERHLPERIKSGKPLSETDLQEIKTLLNRRDQHLERLYGYITNMTEENTHVKAQMAHLTNQVKKKSQDISKIKDIPAIELDYNQTNLLGRIHELESSTSWKITAPLRKIINLFRSH